MCPTLEVTPCIKSQDYILTCKNILTLIEISRYHIENPYYDTSNIYLDLNVNLINRKDRKKLNF